MVYLLCATGQTRAEPPPPSAPAPPAERLRQARALVDADRCADAIPVLREVAESPSGAALARSAAMLLFDCEVRARDSQMLAQDSTKLCAMTSLSQDAEFRRTCLKLEAGLLQQKLESLVKAGQPRKAAELAVEFSSKHPDEPRQDELLYNAGVWFDQAGEPVQAQRARFRLLAARANSPLSLKALYASAERFEKIGAHDRAASCLEEYGASEAGEIERSAAALESALDHRIHLGDARRAQSDFDLFVRRYGSLPARRETAAAMFLRMAHLYAGPAQRRSLEAHLREYLQTWSRYGGVPAEIIATAGLAELLWERSCPVPMIDGVCAAQRVTEGRLARSPKPGLVKRTATLEKEAASLFGRVVGLWRGLTSSGAKPPSADEDPSPKAVRLERARQAAERILFLRADAEYERSLASPD